MMEVNDFVTIASQFMLVGAVFECICILIGYAIQSVFRMIEEGGK